MLEVKDLHAGYDKTEIVHGVSFDVEQGQFVCIIGANGCGKTTVLKNLLGLIRPFSGQVIIDGRDTREMNERELARCFAYIPQTHRPPFPYSVADVVVLGRTPYLGSIVSNVSDRDKIIAYRAMCQLGIEGLADKEYTALSGGQQQLVLIARALTQQPKVLVMDEPTASLDFGNQQLVLSRMYELSRLGMTVLMVTHDPDHALYCSDRVIVMEEGVIIADGTPADTITGETLERIYDSKVCVTDVEVSPGRFVRACIPLMMGKDVAHAEGDCKGGGTADGR